MNEEFYQNCAISAMQGILESGIKFAEISAMLLPKKLANEAFNIADAMVEEYQNRKDLNSNIPAD